MTVLIVVFIFALVPIGGVLFEDWMTESGGYNSRRESKHLRTTARETEQMVSEGDMRDLIARERVAFWANTLISLNHIGQQARKQMFYVHAMIKFRGVSNSGGRLLGLFGVTLPRRSYQKFESECVAMAQEITRCTP